MYTGYGDVSVLYILHPPINFSSANIGYMTAQFNGLKFIGASFINYVFLHKLGIPDIRILTIFPLAFIGFCLTLAFTTTAWEVFACKLWYVKTLYISPQMSDSSQINRNLWSRFFLNPRTFSILKHIIQVAKIDKAR